MPGAVAEDGRVKRGLIDSRRDLVCRQKRPSISDIPGAVAFAAGAAGCLGGAAAG